MKQTLAYRSAGILLGSAFGFIVSLGASILYIISQHGQPANDFDGYIFLIAFFAFLFYFIVAIRAPKERIKYDDLGLYVYKSRKREIFVPYQNIDTVIQRNNARRWIVSTSGKIRINLIDGGHVGVDFIYEVDSVKSKILELKYMHKLEK